uniref:FAD dependent oxidoreductase domain-containing protein n=1 Tax=Alexandrium monilatum TaxID=311494 RepID=A0A7S4UE62_9DINO
MAAPPGRGGGRCLVLGAGAQGLACAFRLWEQGWEVTILARDWLEGTTSSGAGAIWEYPPFHIEPQEAARQWVLSSHGPFQAIAGLSTPSSPSGARVRRAYYVCRDRARAADAYAAVASEPFLKAREGLPPSGLVRPGTFSCGFSLEAPVICMKLYLPWLTNAVGQLAGVRFVQAAVLDTSDVHRWKRAEGAQLVVNCLGLGSCRVFEDPAVHGVRGDLVYVAAPGVEDSFDAALVSDEDHPDGLTYMVAQGNGIMALAGAAEKVGELEGPVRPPQEQLDSILKRNVESFPCLGPSPVVMGDWSGLRPQREGGVRLELAHDATVGPVIHDYGHGGSGVVTSWGCAADVAKMASEFAASAGLALRARSLPPSLLALSAAGAPSRL